MAWVCAFLLRFNFDIPPNFVDSLLQNAIWVIPLQSGIFVLMGLYRGVWRFASLPDLKRILRAIGIGAFLVVAILYMFQPHGVVPRSVLIMDPILLLLLMGGSRFAYRAWKEHRLYGSRQLSGEPVLVLGAGEAAITLLKDLSKSSEWYVVGLLDEKKSMRGRELLGVKVLGDIEQLPDIASALAVSHVIVAMPSAKRQSRRKVIDLATTNGLKVLTVPSFEDLMSGRVSMSQVRPVEVEDLLGREPVSLDDDGLHHLIDGKVAMVSGAGGSIGSELCRQVLKFQPSCLVCFDLSEFALYRLEQEFSQMDITTQIEYIVGDVRNDRRVRQIIGQYQPSIVFHAAAYKHVPMMESRNVAESLSNNVNGTYTLAKSCKDAGVAKFVMVSTDKAVNPTNVMGASKRLAEMVCQGLQSETGTRFVIVRFGNVLGSSGSVIPKFREQIAQGGPITVTHPEITRYFMSIPEASQLVMQAGAMGRGGEIFVLDMGEPVKIVDLARDMIRLSGLADDEIEITYSGLRPGEKLYEELLADDELTLPTPHDKLRIAVARTADEAWVQALLKWVDRTSLIDETVIKQELRMWVEEYLGDINADIDIAPALGSSTIH
ncbi:polysaccharide biosynthesis protein [Methylobacillus gramineus]|uniref:polysaccharide biosynthesis protein n=1 Tax=Methylobacillus gramineus TaxID=755169 RepID=UPI001CFFEA3A|nr:nucleoside-diphosphate sugar epimerase/dehydratase [Methylobacillus gramineus]MCB5184133.1 polysaccharide biosynthesis protein [Methylobacillus gramineus]